MPKRAAKPPTDLPPEIAEFLAGLDPEQTKALISQLLQLGEEQFEQALRPVRQSRRRPRRDAHTLVVRIDLVAAKPPIWRRVELPSTLMLDTLHDLLQVLFGWTDSHLHRFALGSSVWDREAELFLCPDDVEEGEDDGVPTDQVRVDEVLGNVGDALRYVYDYGDEWLVLLKVEKVMNATCDRPRVMAGKHDAPPDDSGGIWDWNERRGAAPLDVGELDAIVAESWT